MVQASAEKLENTEMQNRIRWPQYHKVISWQGQKSLFLQKEKKHGHQSKSRDCEMKESQSRPEHHLRKQ